MKFVSSTLFYEHTLGKVDGFKLITDFGMKKHHGGTRSDLRMLIITVVTLN